MAPSKKQTAKRSGGHQPAKVYNPSGKNTKADASVPAGVPSRLTNSSDVANIASGGALSHASKVTGTTRSIVSSDTYGIKGKGASATVAKQVSGQAIVAKSDEERLAEEYDFEFQLKKKGQYCKETQAGGDEKLPEDVVRRLMEAAGLQYDDGLKDRQNTYQRTYEAFFTEVIEATLGMTKPEEKFERLEQRFLKPMNEGLALLLERTVKEAKGCGIPAESIVDNIQGRMVIVHDYMLKACYAAITQTLREHKDELPRVQFLLHDTYEGLKQAIYATEMLFESVRGDSRGNLAEALRVFDSMKGMWNTIGLGKCGWDRIQFTKQVHREEIAKKDEEIEKLSKQLNSASLNEKKKDSKIARLEKELATARAGSSKQVVTRSKRHDQKNK